MKPRVTIDRKVNIVHENGDYWVLRNKLGYHAMVSGLAHSVSDSSYADASLAVARVDYLAKTHTEGRNLSLAIQLATRARLV
jgi:hypothetical protein